MLGIILSLLFAAPSQAQQAPVWAGVIRVTDLNYRVWACNPAIKPGLIRLLDSKGNIFFEQYSSAANFGQKLDLSRLENGTYTILVKIGADEHRFSVHMQSSSRHWAEVTPAMPAAAPRQVAMETVPVPETH